MPDHLYLAGAGDALGVPRTYCTCPVCTEARTGGANRRLRCSAVLRSDAGAVWLDCGPDWRRQMEACGLREAPLVVLTHAHHDHIGGLPELADVCRWTGRPARVLAPAGTLEEVRRRYPWVANHLDLEPLHGPVDLAGYRLTAWEVNHGRNGRSHALRWERPDFAWAYCPDSIRLSPAEQAPLHGLDLLVLGTAYYQEQAPAPSRSMYDMVEALPLLAAVRPARTVFTHLSHGVDSRRDYGLPAHVVLARDGMEVALA